MSASAINELSPVKKIRKTRKDKGIKRGPRKPKTAATNQAAALANPIKEPPKLESTGGSLKFEDNCSRSPLGEGRSYGFALAFCKVKDGVASTVGPISCCLDYLNDQCYSENTGKPYSAYGYHAKKSDCIGEKAHLVMAVLPYKNGTSYDGMDAELAYAKESHHKIAKFINNIEAKIGLKTPTSVVQVAENRYLFSIDPFWCKWTYLISMWAKLCRIGLESRKQVAPSTFEESMAMLDPNKIKTTDSSYAAKITKAINSFVAGVVPDDTWNDRFWHNAGISNFSKL